MTDNNALKEWREARDAHIRAYGRPPSFRGPLDDYHLELARKWLAAVDEVGVTYGVGKLSDILNRCAAEAAAELRDVALTLQVANEQGYFVGFSGEDGTEAAS